MSSDGRKNKKRRLEQQTAFIDWDLYDSNPVYRKGVDAGRNDMGITARDNLKSMDTLVDDREKYREERDRARQQAAKLTAERDQAEAVLDNVIPPGMDELARAGATRVSVVVLISLGEKDGRPTFMPIHQTGDFVGDPIAAIKEIVPQMYSVLGLSATDLSGDSGQFGFTTKEQWSLLAQLFIRLPDETDSQYAKRRKSALDSLWKSVDSPTYPHTRSAFTDMIGKFITRTTARRKRRVEKNKRALPVSSDFLDDVQQNMLALPDGKDDDLDSL
jgi:hypothetical protein